MTSPLNIREIERIKQIIKEIDDLIDDAQKLISQGKAIEARKKIIQISPMKTEILRILPDVIADGSEEGESRIRFEDLYLLLRHFMYESALVRLSIIDKEHNVSWFVPKPDKKELSAAVNDTLTQLSQWLGQLDWVLDEEKEKLKELVELATHIRNMFRNFCTTGNSPTAADENRLNEVDKCVEKFLRLIFDEFDYWQTFWYLHQLDSGLELAAFVLIRTPITKSDLKNASERLQEAERSKHALQRIIEVLEPKPLPYEPGMEDLIPFPPPDHA